VTTLKFNRLKIEKLLENKKRKAVHKSSGINRTFVALAKISLNLITQCNFKPIKNKLYSFKLKTTVTNKSFGTGAVLKLT